MASNQSKVTAFYAGKAENSRAYSSRSVHEEFHYTEKSVRRLIKPGMRMLELGCATGYYTMLFSDICADCVGIDISPENIAVFNEKLADGKHPNVSATVGDATRLDGIADESFDIVLCLGPMYHLPPDERESVFAECRRVLKPGGYAAFAYINALGVYAGAIANSGLRKYYPNPDCNKAVLEGLHDDVKPDIFFYSSPELMEQCAVAHGFEVIANNGLDFFFAAESIDEMDDVKFACWRELADKMSESRSCVGLSNHALLSCRKV